MADPAQSPSHALRWGTRLAGVLFATLLAVWIVVLAAGGLLHAWIVPNIGGLLPRIEAGLSKAIDMPVRIGAISAQPNGWLPTITLSDVVIGATGSADALRLPRAVLTLSPRSLWRGRLSQIYLEGMVARVRRTAGGRIEIAGTAVETTSAQGPDAAADWIFSQPEIVLRHARIEWLDDLRALPAVALSDVDVVLRNAPWRHAMRIDATPPPAWGDRFTVAGRFRQKVFSRHNGQWADWSGAVHTRWNRFDAEAIRAYLPALPDGESLEAASGGLQAWLDVRQGAATGGTIDLALRRLEATLAKNAQPFDIRDVSGRISAHRDGTSFHIATRQLAFTSGVDGARWPATDATFSHVEAAAGQPARTVFQAEQLDLATASRLAARLPVPPPSRAWLESLAPTGMVRGLDVQWIGDTESPVDYRMRGRVEGFGVAALAAVPAPTPVAKPGSPAAPVVHIVGRPGVSGLQGTFDVQRASGSADIVITDGHLEFPGVFEQPVVPVAQLRTTVRWKHSGDRLRVDADKLEFANDDLAGHAAIHWQTSPDPRSAGVLDLTGALTRANGGSVWRYLPLDLGDEARHYVRDAVRAGVSVDTRFKVRGDLHHLPFTDPALGDFRIASQIRGATYAFAPPTVQTAGELPWPVLTGLAGELVFERNGMEVRNATGRLVMPSGPAGGIRVSQASARIDDLARAVVNVEARAQGLLQDMLAVVDASPLSALTDGALASASATGGADLALQLALPTHALERSTVRGSLTLAGNELRIGPDLPALTRAQGTIAFTETGFTVPGVQATFLGGPLRVEAGTDVATPSASAAVSVQARGSGDVAKAAPGTTLRLRGTADMGAVQRAPELAFLAPVARHASGSANYSATIALRAGGPDVLVTSDLRGIALDLPPPFGKPASEALPLRFEQRHAAASAGTNARMATGGDALSLSLGDLASVRYERAAPTRPGDAPVVLRGRIAIGAQADADADAQAPLPTSGVVADIRLPEIDVGRWQALLAGASPATATATATAVPVSEAAGQPDPLLAYLPTTMAVRTDLLTVAGRSLHGLVADGSRSDGTWKATLAARELDGVVEYREASPSAPPRLFARLARLEVPDASTAEVDSLLDEPSNNAKPLPALDIVVDDLLLHNRSLGRVQVLAVHAPAVSGPPGHAGERAWQLQKLDLRVPEAHFAATGHWARKAGNREPVTTMDFRLDITDAGALLARFGMPGLIRRSPGRLEGTASWAGSPIHPDYPSMDGRLKLDLAAGQFLKADPGLAKLLGVLSLQSLPRRLALDFRDVFSEGFAFDSVRGDVEVKTGIASTQNFQMKGVTAAVLMEGETDLGRETQDLHVVVVPELNVGTASIVAGIINPAVGVASFLAQVLLRGPLMKAATREFHISGSWADPKVERLSGAERTGVPNAR